VLTAEEKKEVKKDRLGVAIDPTAAAFAAFDRSYADKAAAAKAAAAAQQRDANYKGAFAGLVDEVPQIVQEDEGSSGDEGSSATPAGTAAAAAKPKQPKAPKKPKLTVAQVAAGAELQQEDRGYTQGFFSPAAQHLRLQIIHV
jgi:hypothetical protein